MDVRLYFKRKERDEDSQGKMQGSRQIEMGGDLGVYKNSIIYIVITTPLWGGGGGQYCLVNTDMYNNESTCMYSLVAHKPMNIII